MTAVEINKPTIRPTRFKELGYSNHAPGLWRIIDNETGCAVGPHYISKGELLADLNRYAAQYGCSNADPDTLPPMNGTRITRHKDGNTIFIPLPRILWRSAGRCDCNVCKGKEGFWDTLALTSQPENRATDTAWTVHYPELQR